MGLVDEGMGGGGREWVSKEGLEMRAVFSAVVLAACSAACLSAFCCFRILSTTHIVSAAPPSSHSTHRYIHVA
jgi:hypothetical protein